MNIGINYQKIYMMKIAHLLIHYKQLLKMLHMNYHY